MLGYYENPTATAESLTEDRTLKTGDFAYRNKGLSLFLQGELILS